MSLNNLAFRNFQRDSDETTRRQLRCLAEAIDLYILENRALPKSLDELTLRSPKLGEPFMKCIPHDPWRGSFGYRVIDEREHEYEIRSAGEDGRFGTDDDVVLPEPKARR